MKILTCSLLIFVSCSGSDNLHAVCQETCFDDIPERLNVGQCHAGKPICDKDMNVIKCDGEITSQAEICDGIDNDCDGKIDNDFYGKPLLADLYSSDNVCGRLGECSRWDAVCVAGQWTCPYQPQPEVCNGLDDNCDGRIDNDVYANVSFSDRVCYDGNPIESALYPPCHAGLFDCIDGNTVCVNEQIPEVEICDGIDNNCNGIIDDTALTLSTKYDIVFIVDNSESMCDKISAVSAALQAYAQLFNGNSSYRFAIVNCSVYLPSPPYDILDTDFADFSILSSRLSSFGCAGNGSESSLDAAYHVCSSANSLGLSWRVGANRMFFELSDELGQSYNVPPYTQQDVINACLQTSTLPFFWKRTSDYDTIATAANGETFYLSTNWQDIFNNMNSIIIQLCR